MKILFLDLSTKSTGWCIGQNGNLLSYGCVTASSKYVEKRIIKMRDQIKQIIKNNKIDFIVAEEVRPEYNSHTSKVLIWLQGAIIVGAYQINPKIKYQFIVPSSWRAALKMKQGSGIKRDKLKPQDIQYVQDKYNIKVNDDQADAICLFEAYQTKFNNQINWE